MSDSTLRVEARFKNARLYNAIAERTVPLTTSKQRAVLARHGPVSNFCKIYNLNRADRANIYKLLNLRLHPIQKVGRTDKIRVLPLCERLAVLLERDVAWLFPADLYAIHWPSIVVEIPHERFRPLSAATPNVLLLPPTQDETIVQHELRQRMADALDTLTPREEMVLRSRYGLGPPTKGYANPDVQAMAMDRDEHTYDEIGKAFGVSRERVRQIEAKALRRLRHPSRSRTLSAFLETSDYVAPRESVPPVPATIVVDEPLDTVIDVDAPRLSWSCQCFLHPDVLRHRDWETDVRVHSANGGTHWNHRITKVRIPIARPNSLKNPHLIYLVVEGDCQPMRYTQRKAPCDTVQSGH